MGIIDEQLIELINITLKDMPPLPIELLLDALSNCETDSEADNIINYIYAHHTPYEILEEITKRLKCIKFLFRKGK